MAVWSEVSVAALATVLMKLMLRRGPWRAGRGPIASIQCCHQGSSQATATLGHHSLHASNTKHGNRPGLLSHCWPLSHQHSSKSTANFSYKMWCQQPTILFQEEDDDAHNFWCGNAQTVLENGGCGGQNAGIVSVHNRWACCNNDKNNSLYLKTWKLKTWFLTDIIFFVYKYIYLINCSLIRVLNTKIHQYCWKRFWTRRNIHLRAHMNLLGVDYKNIS